MNAKLRFKWSVSLVFVSLISLLVSCGEKKPKPKEIELDPGFDQYISAYTTGLVSTSSTVRIRVTDELSRPEEQMAETSEKVFSFEPSIKGSIRWVDKRTLEFKPAKKLEPGTLFKGTFNLNKIAEVPQKYESFDFSFQTLKQNFSITEGNLKVSDPDNPTNYIMEGVLTTADFIEDEKIEKVLKAKIEGQEFNIQWDHRADDKKHFFTINNIPRTEKEKELLLFWDGLPIGVDSKGEKKYTVPGLEDFRLLSVEVVQLPEQHVLLRFSDPIAPGQELSGLIQLNSQKIQIKPKGSEIRVYPSKRMIGTSTVGIERDIKNTSGFKLKSSTRIDLNFGARKPELRLLGDGVIVPGSTDLIFPFEAVNLKAVDVRITRIFENNIVQFFQQNRLDGDNDLKRVGRLVYRNKIDLVSGNVIDYGQWNAFSFDLSDLIDVEPGEIYQVELRFRKAYAIYPCGSEANNEETSGKTEEEKAKEEMEYWTDPDRSWYYEYGWDYNWNERDNPCSNSYYRSRRWIKRNVLASNLGIIAKQGNDKKLKVAVTDLRTTEPLQNIEIEIYDFQQQWMGTTVTDNNGFAEINLQHHPFLLVAKNGKERGYLRLDNGSSLSLSSFDVSGNVVQKGLKGYIYGERGVWRPGDSLFVSFVLEDKAKLLPADHPVTFELVNPQGQLVKRMVKTESAGGFYSFKMKTDSDAPTGNWQGCIKVGGTTFNKRFRIETVKPNRLKIKIDFGKEKLSVLEKNTVGKLSAKWLHGAIAGNLRAKVDVVLKPVSTRFKKFPDFHFDDPARTYDPFELTLIDKKTDAKGETTVPLNISKQNNAPGMLKAVFTSRVFEEGGDFSIDQFSIPYAPYQYFVGIRTPKGDRRNMLLTDENHKIEVITVDAEGKPVKRNNLKVYVYKVRWRWWWDASSENFASYVGSRYHQPILKKVVHTDEEGKGSFSLKIKYPDWGRYLIHVSLPKGHSTGKTVYVDWPGWAERSSKDNPGGATMLSFSSDKEKYNVGEDATVTLPAAKNGRALVSIENGSRVLANYWVNTGEEATAFKFKITPEMSPNVYVNVTLVQPHAQTVNDRPIRMYGVIPLLVEDPATRIAPVIEMADELRSESDVSIKIKEQEGKAMNFTLAVVDEGLLDLTRFKTPNAWNTFYAREALGVRTWDVYNYVLGAYGGKLEKIFAIGGDDEIINKDKKKANRFKPVVKFFGPYQLKKGESKTIRFKMPPYVGSVRTMVVAGHEGAYGSAEKAVPVRDPLMLLATLPRVLGPKEEVKLPVTLFAMHEKVKSVKVRVEVNNLLQVSGASEQTITFDQPGEKDIYFDLITQPNLGVGKVKVIAEGAGERAEYEVELDVRNPNPEVTKSVTKIVQPGESLEIPYTTVGMDGTNSGTLEVANIAPIDFGRRLHYLLGYPHGCIEQTTSAAFPQLYLSQVMETNEETRERIRVNVSAAIDRIRKFQHSSGGFTYWPGHGSPNNWGTSYAGHFLLEAEAKGYDLPIGLMDRWKKYQRQRANEWRQYSTSYRRNDLNQAYRLYTLALAGDPQLGAMNRLREIDKLSKQARWRLAAAYVLAGQPEVAQELVNLLDLKIEEYRELSYTYGSTNRDYAMLLETLTQMKVEEEAVPIVTHLSEVLSSKQWMSTQTTAYALMAMTKFAGSDNATDKQLRYVYQMDAVKEEAVISSKPINQMEMKIKSPGSGKVKVTNQGESKLFVNLAMKGIPLIGDTVSDQRNLMMSLKYLDMKGNPINPRKIIQGTDFKVVATIENRALIGDFKEMALSQIFPSGWEIRNTRLYESSVLSKEDIPTYRDIRDDRVYTYFDIPERGKRTYEVYLNAAYVGKFYLPTTLCDAMYDDKIYSRKAGFWVEVVKQE